MEDKKYPVKKVLFICSKATLESVYACFIMANGARMEGIESEIFFHLFWIRSNSKKENG